MLVLPSSAATVIPWRCSASRLSTFFSSGSRAALTSFLRHCHAHPPHISSAVTAIPCCCCSPFLCVDSGLATSPTGIVHLPVQCLDSGRDDKLFTALSRMSGPLLSLLTWVMATSPLGLSCSQSYRLDSDHPLTRSSQQAY